MIATWGDKPLREQPVTRTQLVTILSNNALGNVVLYRVSAGLVATHTPAQILGLGTCVPI